MKVYPLVWNSPEKYQRHILLIGIFHLLCTYMKMIGKKMACTGLGDVFVEAGLVSGGSLAGVTTGKHYERALHCHTIILKSLESLLIEAHFKNLGTDDLFGSLSGESFNKLHDRIQSLRPDAVDAVAVDPAMNRIVEQYTKFRESVRSEGLGKTAQLWLYTWNAFVLSCQC